MKKSRLDRIIKKLTVASLISVFALQAVACGSTDTAEATDNSSDVSTEESGVNSVALNAEDFDIDAVPEFTIRVGVCAGDDNQYLKILDDHTNFLKDRGINLETTEFAAGINTIDAITIDQLDIGNFADYAGINRIGNTLGDTELRALTMTTINTNYNLYVNPDHIKSVEDLEGAVLLSQAGVVFEYEYGKLVETYNLDADKIKLTNVSSAQEALALAATGQGDAYWVNKQNAAKFAEEGWEPLVNIVDIGAPMYCFLVANDSYLQAHQAEVAKYLEVSEEGFAYITENLDEFAGWVEEELGLSKDLVIEGWNEKTHDYGFTQEAYEDLQKVEEWCYNNGNFPTSYDPADYINTDALALYKPDSVTWSAK